MTNVLLTKKYKAHTAGEILRDLHDGEATALETLGVGQKLKDDQAEHPAPKKVGKGADAE